MRQAIIDAYAAKEKIEAVAAEFNVSPSYVSRLARRRGLKLRLRKVEHSSQPVLINTEAQ